MKSVTLICYILLIVASLQAQTEKITQLRKAEITATNSAERLTSALLLLDEHESLFKDSVIPLAQRTMSLAGGTGDKSIAGRAALGLINAYLRADNPSAADTIIRRALPQYPLSDKSLADIGLKLRLARTSILASRADYESAVKELFSIVQDAERLENFAMLSRAFNELGVISYNRNELPQALDYYRKALSLGDRHSSKEQVEAYAYINIAMVHGWLEHYDSALYYLALAKPICERLQNLYYLANAYVVEANIYKWSKRLPQAEAAMLKMVALREKTEGSITFSNEQLSLANFYVYAKDFAKAIAIYTEGLSYSDARTAAGIPTNFELVLHYYEGLSKCYSSIGARDDYETALQQIIAFKDSLNTKNATDAIAEMQTKYEVQKKETTIIAQKLDITRKNFLFYGSLLLTLLGILIGWLLFRAYRRKSRLRLEEEMRHAAQAVKEAEEGERKRIAADLHDSLGSYAASIKSNADEMRRSQPQPTPVLELLQTNAQQMVSLLSDTIWAMRKERLMLSDISDRIKVVLQRLRPNYPGIILRVEEDLGSDAELPPVHAYHLFMIIQEAVNNALRHSGGDRVTVSFQGGDAWKVRVSDNGKGFKQGASNSDGSNGLHNMRARAESMGASIEWKSLPPQGMEVCLSHTPN